MAACAWWISRACHYVRRLKAVCEQAQGQPRLDLRRARSCGRGPCAPASPRSSGPCPSATTAVTQCSMCMLLHVASAINERLRACTSVCCHPQASNPFHCTSAAFLCAAARFCVEEPFCLARNKRECRRTHRASMLRLSVWSLSLWSLAVLVAGAFRPAPGLQAGA